MEPNSTGQTEQEAWEESREHEQQVLADLLPDGEDGPQPENGRLPFSEEEEEDERHDQLKAIIEALVYVTDDPLTPEQLAGVLEVPKPLVVRLLQELASACDRPDRGLWIREVAGGYKMATKPEHHEVVRHFVKKLMRPLKLSAAALETLAVVAYKQPITAPEVMAIRGVQGASSIKTLLDNKLIATAGRKNVIGKPILYRTTKDFLVQFGLKSLNELPTLKEFEELSRMALQDEVLEPEEAAEKLGEAAASASMAGGQGETESSEAEEIATLEEEPADPMPEEAGGELERERDSGDGAETNG